VSLRNLIRREIYCYNFLINLSVLTDSTEALEFGQKKLTSFGKVPKYVEKLEVLFP